jgi:hypothetical protein
MRRRQAATLWRPTHEVAVSDVPSSSGKLKSFLSASRLYYQRDSGNRVRRSEKAGISIGLS